MTSLGVPGCAGCQAGVLHVHGATPPPQAHRYACECRPAPHGAVWDPACCQLSERLGDGYRLAGQWLQWADEWGDQDMRQALIAETRRLLDARK